MLELQCDGPRDVPQGALLVEALLALGLLGLIGTSLVLLMHETVRQAREGEQMSELLPHLSHWIHQASPGETWRSPEGDAVRWHVDGFLEVDLRSGGRRILPWHEPHTMDPGAL
jgi:hypothetical protein